MVTKLWESVTGEAVQLYGRFLWGFVGICGEGFVYGDRVYEG